MREKRPYVIGLQGGGGKGCTSSEEWGIISRTWLPPRTAALSPDPGSEKSFGGPSPFSERFPFNEDVVQQNDEGRLHNREGGGADDHFSSLRRTLNPRN
ncbi:hypothetical protein CDAR_461801 [Caerostris darwini]|uniref:Uncharacterized protein n=1 Tax=Caerostris darwini TaxID=1538125 RepID=A0AAV4TDK2_9ARAC|nr:hypothetical protein CDAR_461801 [Caerostris darwini]